MPNTLDDAIRAREESRYADAHAILAELLAANPADAEAYYQMAWLHDAQGLERAALPFYEIAISGDLPDDDLRGALLGYGSTLRALGEYPKAVSVLRQGMERFPDAGEFPAFLAMALYNDGKERDAVALLLKELVRSSADAGIQRFQRAILYYHDKLDETWDGEGENDSP